MTDFHALCRVPTVSSGAPSNRQKILLASLGSFGDCILTTPIAKQIKIDYPDSYLVWAIGSLYRGAIDCNPFVDEILEIPLRSKSDLRTTWYYLLEQIKTYKRERAFDRYFLTQTFPGNVRYFDGTVRAPILRAYPHPITVPVTPILNLNQHEVKKVRSFIERIDNYDPSHAILFECSPQSGQSFVTPDYALNVARKLVDKIPSVTVFLSSNLKVSSQHPRVIDVSCLSVRENVELANHCGILIGCSSGISWACTSTWAKPIQMIQLLNTDQSAFASMVHDHEYHGLPTDHILEMTNSSVERLTECVYHVLKHGMLSAKREYHETITMRFEVFSDGMAFLCRRLDFYGMLHALCVTVKRYGLRLDIFLALFRTSFKKFKRPISDFDTHEKETTHR